MDKPTGRTKLSKRRRRLPTAPKVDRVRTSERPQKKQQQQQQVLPVLVERYNAEKLKRLSSEILMELEAVDASNKFMPGEVGVIYNKSSNRDYSSIIQL